MSRNRRSSTRTARRLPIERLESRLLRSTTYYVAPGGSDYAAGTKTAPYATIQNAEYQVQPGDTVIVEPGTYAGFNMGYISSSVSGTASAPITFEADPTAAPGSVIINSRNISTPDGIDLEPGNSYVNIEGFTVTNGGTIARAGIRVTGSDHVNVLNNTVSGCGDWGILSGFANYLLIEGNSVSGSIAQHGIYVGNSSTGDSIIGNTVFNNHMCGIHLNGDASQGGSGMITDATVEDNIIYNNGLGGGSAINCDGVADSIIENNLLYGNHASGISLYHIDGTDGSTNDLVVNNTIEMASDGRWAININSASTGTTLFNNVLFDDNGYNGSVDISSDSLAGFVSDHNIVAAQFAVDDNTMSLSQWQSQTGQDTDSVQSTPSAVFVNPAAGNYDLVSGAATSVGVSSLNNQSAPTTDVYGNLRSGASDVGATERAVHTIPDAVNPALNDLVVGGSGANDVISLTLSGGMVSVDVNGTVTGNIPASSLAEINVHCGPGGDTVTVAPSVTVGVFIHGGGGNDSLTGASNDTLAGGGGNDTLVAAGSGDFLYGRGGNDELIGQAAGADTVYGAGGNDATIVEMGPNVIVTGGTNESLFT
jgi:parallel beta-helix repeat protein